MIAMDDRTNQLTYSSDQPIQSRREDRFNRALFAQRVAETTATRSDPSSIVVGLYGPWGGGKSSTLNLMEEALGDHSNVIVVRFNPWLYGSEERLLQGFFDTLAAVLGDSLPAKAGKVGGLIRDYGALLLASCSVAEADLAHRGDVVRRAGGSQAGVRLDDVKHRVEEALQQAGKRVVVLIDDIDRLDRAEIQAIFKLVKLSANFASTSYVLSFDDEMVASSIGERYGKARDEAGRDYLAKFIQVPLHLPPADTMQLRQMAFDGVAAVLRQSRVELDKEQVDVFAHHFVGGLEPRLGTPRHAKLYVNAVTFALPLLEEEAHPVDLLLMEGIRVFYPKLYLAIRDNADLFLSGGRDPDQNTESAQRRRLTDLIRECLNDVAPEQAERLRRDLLEPLFPRLGKARYGHDRELDWARQQRVCSEQYFHRYFTYSVPAGDIGDVEVKSFLDGIASADAAAQDAALLALAQRGAFARLIQKLQRAASTMREDAACGLALAIARNGPLACVEQAETSALDSTLGHASHLIADLVRQTPDVQARDRIARSIAQVAEPLTFAFECLRCMRRTAGVAQEEQVLSEEGDLAAHSALVDRIRSQAAAAPLHRSFGREARGLYGLWAQQCASEVASNLQQTLQSDPAEADALLDSYVGEPHESAAGSPPDADISHETYDALAQLIDPRVVAGALEQVHGPGLGAGDFYRRDAPGAAQQRAHQFLWLYRSGENAPAQDPAGATDTGGAA